MTPSHETGVSLLWADAEQQYWYMHACELNIYRRCHEGLRTLSMVVCLVCTVPSSLNVETFHCLSVPYLERESTGLYGPQPSSSPDQHPPDQ